MSIRQLLTFAAVLALLWVADPWPPTYVTGCALAAIGIWIRAWGCGHLRKNLEVTTSGPYAYVRNPLYLGTLLIAAGGILAAGSARMPSLLAWAVLAPLFLVYFFLIYMPKKRRIEGGRLEDRYAAEFEEYNRTVPELLPSLRRYPKATRRPWSWSTFRDNHELGLDLLLVVVFAAMPLVADWKS